jgi:hypothetical protein
MKLMQQHILKTYTLAVLIGCSLLMPHLASARGRVDPCKNHDRCKAHDKCRKHARGHARCVSKNPPQRQTTFSGQAVVVNITNLLHGPPTVVIGDTGRLPSAGGTRRVEINGTNVQDFLRIDMATASTTAGGHQSVSHVSIQDFALMILATNGTTHTVSFDSLEVSATAECDASGNASVNASTTITGLMLDGMAVNVTGEANQRIDYDGGFIMINVRSSTVNSDSGEITIAGLYIHNDGCMDGPVGLAHADIRCGTTPPAIDCSDRVTGGGFIFGTPSRERANFGIGGGIQNGRLWGHLNYIDHDTGMHVKATSVTGYEVVDADTRMIKYNVTIDGAVGTATVLATDTGEPGRDDILVIELSNGYMASGDLGGSEPGGGNIQLHKAKCR